MKRHLVIIYWLLLLVSTLAIGGVAFFLLQRENVRLRAAASNGAVDTGKKIATNLEVLVDDLKNNSMEAMAKMPEDESLPKSLLDWKNTNRYARSVILYLPSHGLDLPLSHTEERENIEPYLHKPDGHWVWSDSDGIPASFTITSYVSRVVSGGFNRGNSRGGRSGNSTPPGPRGGPPPGPPGDNISQMKQDRMQIREATRGSASGPAGVAGNAIPDMPNTPGLSISGNLAGTTIQIELSSAGLPSVDALVGQDKGQNIAKINALPSDVVFTQFEGNLVLNSGMAPVTQMLVNQHRVSSSLPTHQDRGWMIVGPADDLQWLGWMRPTPGGPVRGLVLNWDALGSAFANTLGGRIDPAAGYILRNPAGQAVAVHFANGKMVQDGSGNATAAVVNPAAQPRSAPISILPLDPATLPGWALEVYYDTTTAFTGGFMAASTILVTLLVVSVLVGGTLLLREARREAFEAARKTSFVSNVSHELKTPLTTIRMYAELLGEGRVRDENRQRSYLATIINESQRLTRLVNNVLDFSRLEQGRKQYNPDDLVLAPVIESVLEAQHPRLQEAGFAVETDFPPGREVHVRADRDALEQVLINLMDNAMKYAAAGHWLRIRVTTEGEHAKIIVSDHGPGVPPAHRERIFETFHRVDDSITAKLPGAGLGLSIARRLLRDQEGDLRYEPNEPNGSSFVATLPLYSVPTAAKFD